MLFTALSAPGTGEENIFSSSPFFPSISSLSCAIRLTYLLYPSLAVHAYTPRMWHGGWLADFQLTSYLTEPRGNPWNSG